MLGEFGPLLAFAWIHRVPEVVYAEVSKRNSAACAGEVGTPTEVVVLAPCAKIGFVAAVDGAVERERHAVAGTEHLGLVHLDDAEVLEALLTAVAALAAIELEVLLRRDEDGRLGMWQGREVELVGLPRGEADSPADEEIGVRGVLGGSRDHSGRGDGVAIEKVQHRLGTGRLSGRREKRSHAVVANLADANVRRSRSPRDGHGQGKLAGAGDGEVRWFAEIVVDGEDYAGRAGALSRDAGECGPQVAGGVR